jgi:hypothetical protein
MKATRSKSRKKLPTTPQMKRALAAAKRMGRMVREENRRFGLPLIVMKDGKICEIEA